MATTNLLDTKTVTFNEILGNGKIYRVPLYQRDYSWERDHWDDLWSDLLNVYQSGEAHYMGSTVLQVNDDSNKAFWIIDGQQRFTTLSLLTLAVIQRIRNLALNGVDASGNNERAELLTQQYIGQKDPTSLHYSSKLFLNENNDGFYQQRLLTFRPPVNYNKLLDSEKQLWDGYNYFVKRLEELFPSSTDGAKLSAFLSLIVGEQLRFIQITVKDELNAYTVFETLNSRGVELTATDLLKNYLFSLVAKSPNDLNAVKGQWKKIVDAIGLKDFPIFLRHYLNTRVSLVTKEQLFKKTKLLVRTDQEVLDLLDLLEKYAYTYNALFNPDDEFWNGDRTIREHINSLNLFRVTLCIPLLMAAYDRLPLQEFTKVLAAVVTISFRYNVIGKLQTNEMEKVYNKAANNIHSGKSTQANQVVNDLRELYLDDDTFRSYFDIKTFNTTNSTQRKVARYILYKIEGQLADGVKHHYEEDNGTIEHILPENMNAEWSEIFSDEEHARAVYMLGNLTLLEPSKNYHDAAQKTIQEKVKVYNTSQYALTREIANSEWTMKSIKHRQAHLGKMATGIWKL